MVNNNNITSGIRKKVIAYIANDKIPNLNNKIHPKKPRKNLKIEPIKIGFECKKHHYDTAVSLDASVEDKNLKDKISI